MNFEMNTFVDDVVDLGQSFALAVNVLEIPATLSVEKQEEVDVRKGDGVKFTANLTLAGPSVEKGSEATLYRDGAPYVTVKVESLKPQL